MTTFEHTAIETVQGGGAAHATTAPVSPAREQRQQLQDAARQLRDAIRDNVNQELIQARAEAAAEKAVATQAAADGKAPALPVLQGRMRQGGPFTIQTPDGKTTIVQGPFRPSDQGIPREAVDISVAFFLTVAAIIIFLPLARAFARRMDRRSASQMPAEVSAQLEHLNRAVDAIAVEVERISEGQRYTTRLLTEQREAAPSLTTGLNR